MQIYVTPWWSMHFERVKEPAHKADRWVRMCGVVPMDVTSSPTQWCRLNLDYASCSACLLKERKN
jgi:hypothetical protein